MVIVRDCPFDESEYDMYFSDFTNFSLSNFQKWAIKAIVDGDHALITAPTGSGKTLPAEFMIHHFLQSSLRQDPQRKKIIYASPIKALSNQKLHDMRKRFPDISIGLLTGDCKDNPDADVLIMTTEILRNTLFNRKLKETTNEPVPLSFDIDIHNELAGVIFDEVHYIADPDRGSVWEQSILMLPKNVQLVLLSATIDKPKVFAQWIESQECSKNRSVYLLPTLYRIVPLTHYMWLSSSSGSIKKIKDDKLKIAIEDISNKLVLIKDEKGKFYDTNFYKLEKHQGFLYKNYMTPKRQQVLNQLLKYLKINNMLPALCFVFSRSQVESAANEITENLHNDNGILSSTVEKECRKILMTKLINYKDYINLPEYSVLIKLLEKGVGIHHAGMLSIFREMIEMLFNKGFIKILFATETFAVGINMPTKTVIFSSLTKFDGESNRLLQSHEYAQMAGRAGRRGIDTQGTVIHCNSLFKMPSNIEYNKILTGPPQTITSKFKISYNFILNMLLPKNMTLSNIKEFVGKSLLNIDIENDIVDYDKHVDKLKDDLVAQEEIIQQLKTSDEVLSEYFDLTNKLPNTANKTKKRLLRQIDNLESNNPSIKSDFKYYEKAEIIRRRIFINEGYRSSSINYIDNSIQKVISFLTDIGYITKENDLYKVTDLGLIASQIQEMSSIAITTSFVSVLPNLGSCEIAALLSCLTPLNVNDDNKIIRPKTESEYLNASSLELQCSLDKMQKMEEYHGISGYEDYNIHFDLQDSIIKWALSSSAEECQSILDNLNNIGISSGEFVKALIKICNVCREIESACELTDNIRLLEKINIIPGILLKYVVSTQSLYV